MELDSSEIIAFEGFEKDLEQSLFSQLIEKTSSKWEAMFAKLLEFKKKYGHCRVPKDAKEPWKELGKWVDFVRYKQRTQLKKSERYITI